MSTETGMEKQAMRREMLELRRSMSFEQRDAADAAIAKAVLAHPVFRAAKQIFAYVSMPHEVGTRAILEAVLADGKALGLPVCDTETSGMQFYRLDALSELKADGTIDEIVAKYISAE